jgi:hypothetical protein
MSCEICVLNYFHASSTCVLCEERDREIDHFVLFHSIPTFHSTEINWIDSVQEVFHLKWTIFVLFCLIKVDDKQSRNGRKYHHCFDNDVINNNTVIIPRRQRHGRWVTTTTTIYNKSFFNSCKPTIISLLSAWSWATFSGNCCHCGLILMTSSHTSLLYWLLHVSGVKSDTSIPRYFLQLPQQWSKLIFLLLKKLLFQN